ncbi:dihydrolipoyl dehydrogenase [Neorickettsia helminthoeca str. Oregon]|uniref:Dihydrolipoyl dehydrogenase n=1 Tax=Neorickettsia helminthoeca str. Oregon TaxID=1286528 RepID=X5HLS4_9RICK|nr:dihydrolipoyl dehydrogenase [Neorickettsia helminthoeca]AHX11380.1 dihydrolipoyl dehydrogenase [Neorickettsia helminthoeca str. Oregon]
MYDIVIIGGGPAGYPAAIKASKSGLKVALVEKDELGGVCLNRGCIPTKALLHIAEKYHFIKNEASTLGIVVPDVSMDFHRAIEYSREKVRKLADGISYLMNKNKIDVFKSHARILHGKKVVLADLKKTIDAKNIILATGSRARILKGLEYDHKIIWDCRDAMMPNNQPGSLLIVGSGAIGIEFACIYNSFGTKVTVIEIQDRILATEDIEISSMAEDAFKKSGIAIHKSTIVISLEVKEDGALVSLSNGNTLSVDRILVAVGTEANSNDIGLENFSGIKLDRGFVCVDEYCQTGEPGIYAIGDLVGAPCLAHKAIYEASICINKILGKKPFPLDKTNIPSCIYSFPSIASIGLTEEAAKKLGYEIKIGRVKSDGNGKSVVLGKTKGLVKTVFDKKTGELLGAHMIGHEVTEMINGYAIAKASEATSETLKTVVFPHPTMSEMMYESVLAADNEEIHS